MYQQKWWYWIANAITSSVQLQNLLNKIVQTRNFLHGAEKKVLTYSLSYLSNFLHGAVLCTLVTQSYASFFLMLSTSLGPQLGSWLPFHSVALSSANNPHSLLQKMGKKNCHIKLKPNKGNALCATTYVLLCNCLCSTATHYVPLCNYLRATLQTS